MATKIAPDGFTILDDAGNPVGQLPGIGGAPAPSTASSTLNPELSSESLVGPADFQEDFDEFQEDIGGQVDTITDITGEISERAQREYRRQFVQGEDGVSYPIIEYTDDGGQTWTQDESFDFQRPYEALEQLYAASGSVQSFEEWLAAHPDLGQFLDPSQAIGEVGNLLTDIGDTTDEFAGAADFAAQNLGFESGAELQASIQGMLAELEGGIGGQEGFSAEERGLNERFINNLVSGMAVQAQRDVDAMLGETGSTMRAFQTADATRRQIVDVQVQYQLGVAQADFMRKEPEFTALNDRYKLMVEQRLVSQAEYLTQVNQARAVQLQGYAIQIDAILKNNQQLTQVYSADLEALRTHAQITYDAVNLEMGLTQETMQATADAFDQYLSPLYAQLEAEITALDAMMARGQGLVDQATAEALQAQTALTTAQTAEIAGQNPNAEFGAGLQDVGNGMMIAGGALGAAAITAGVAFPPLGIALLIVGVVFGVAGGLAQK